MATSLLLTACSSPHKSVVSAPTTSSTTSNSAPATKAAKSHAPVRSIKAAKKVKVSAHPTRTTTLHLVTANPTAANSGNSSNSGTTQVPTTAIPSITTSPRTVHPTTTRPPATTTTTNSRQPMTWNVSIVNGGGSCASTYCYEPADLTIHSGDTVVWTNNSTVGHTVNSCTSSACSGVGPGSGTDPALSSPIPLNPGTTYRVTFHGIGTYNYYCEFHGYTVMHGTITVIN